MELVGFGGAPGEPDHLVPAGLEGPAAALVFAGEYVGLLVVGTIGRVRYLKSATSRLVACSMDLRCCLIL